MKTIRLKVKTDAYAWLNAAAREVNFVWNWANETSEKAVRRYAGPPKWLTAYDLHKLSSGSSELFERIGSATINSVCTEFVRKRRQAKRARLSWRKSGGSRRSLGWIPFRAETVLRKGTNLRFYSKSIRVFDFDRLADKTFHDGCFAQDACGDWWLCMPVDVQPSNTPAPKEAVAIDLGLKTIATTSDGETLEAGRWTHGEADRLAQVQKRGHKKQAKRIHRRISRRRQDALHKFSTKIVSQYQSIYVGDVSSAKLAKTQMAKSVLDSGWYALKKYLEYKCQQAARTFEVVDEAYTSRACSACGSLSGPHGVNGLRVREWTCSDCGESHSRDINAAKNILRLAMGRPLAGTSRTFARLATR